MIIFRFSLNRMESNHLAGNITHIVNSPTHSQEQLLQVPWSLSIDGFLNLKSWDCHVLVKH